MNWFSENKIFSSILIVILLGCLALGYLTFAERGRYTEALQAYETGMAKLADLRGRSPYRDEGNLKKIQEQVGAYKKMTDTLRSDLINSQGSLAAIDPTIFQNRLRELVSRTVEHANQRGVQLPEKFYLGFEKYENELPRNDITGLLDWQLTAVEAVINRLIDLKISKVENILRPPLPGEISAEPPSKEVPLYKKYPFEVVFLGYPGSLQSILNDMVSLPQFTIVRALRVENEQPKGAPRTGAVTATDAPTVPVEPAVDKIIIGKERVTSAIIVDLVQFTPKQALKK